MSVTMMSLWCHYDVTMMSLWCHYDVTMMPLWCHYDVTMMSLWCHYDVTMMSLWCQWQLEMYICVHGWLRNQYASVIKFWVEKWTCTHSSCCSSCPCVSVLCWPAIARSESRWPKTQSDSSPETNINLHLDEPAHTHTWISTQIHTYILLHHTTTQ